MTFLINEGKRVRIESVEFDGHHAFEASRLRDQFYSHASPAVNQNIFVTKDIDQAGESLVDWMKSKGFLSAKLVAVNKTFVRQDTGVRVLIYLYEGEQTNVKSIKILGVTQFTDEEIQKILSLTVEAPLNLFAFNDGLEVLKARYRDKGFLGVRIKNENQKGIIEYSTKNRFADIVIDLAEGPLYRVSTIEIEGLKRTHPSVILKDVSFREGEVLQEFQLAETDQNLKRLGIFSTIAIQIADDPQKPGFKKVRILLEESGRIRLAMGLGVRNDLGVRVFGEAGYTNLWERNHTWSLLGNVNRRLEDFRFFEFELTMRYAWPHFGIDHLTMRPELTFERQQYILFSADSLSAKLTFEYPLVRKLNLVGAMTYTLERTKQFNATFVEDDQTLTIGSLTPSLQIDLRDNPLSPRKGIFAVTSLEIAVPELGSQTTPLPVSYTRFQFRMDGFIPLFNDVTWFLSFRTGYERNLVEPTSVDPSIQGDVGIPLSKQFALGGPGSLRGFKLQELNFQNFTIQGTLSFVNYRTQIDIPLAGAMRFGPFLDAGALHKDGYSFGGLRYGAGLGIHYRTPVGPVNFDLGFKIRPQPGEDPSRFHFTIGIL